MLTDLERGWVTGLFEGEGCITFQSRSRIKRPVLTMGMTDEDVVRRFHSLVVVGNVRVCDKGPGRKTAYLWSSSSLSGVQTVLQIMFPLLGARRRARAEEALRICREEPLQKDRPRCARGHLFTARLRSQRSDAGSLRWRYCMTCHRNRQRSYREARIGA